MLIISSGRLRIWLGVLLWQHGLAADASHAQNRAQERAQQRASEPLLYPLRLALGSQPSACGGSVRPFHLNASAPIATLDYGHEVAGYPFFDVESVTGTVQIEVKYAEEFNALRSNFSDGPLPFAAALANTYRVETFAISGPGRTTAFLLQGGQRWQTIRLITDGSVTFSDAGLVPTTPLVDIDNLPGAFTCDDDNLNSIWKLGARAASVACFEAGSQGAVWEIDDTNGAFVRGMRPGVTTKGSFFSNYTLEFDARIERGGLGWTVGFTVASPAQGIQLNLVAESQSFVNNNASLTPPNSISVAYGYSLVNVTTLTSWHLGTFDVPFTVPVGTWMRLKSVLDGQHLAVSIGDVQIFNISLRYDYITGRAVSNGLISTAGSFGFGGWQDQAGYVRDVTVYDTANGTELYRNAMTDGSDAGVTREYGVGANSAPACLDGPKRDRLVWLGDFLHTARIVAASTSRFDIARGTLQYLLDWQTPSGLLPYDSPIGYDPQSASTAFALGGGGLLRGIEAYGVILADYQILGLLSFTSYARTSNDLAFVRNTWPKWQALTQWLVNSISPATGLLSLYGAFLGPSNGGSAISCALVQALREMADVATAIGNSSAAASQYLDSATALAAAINRQLWNEEMGIYSLDPTSPSAFSVNGIAFCLTSGVANASQAERFIAALPALQLGPGYKDSTLVNASDPGTNISPNTNGFLLAALLSQPSASAAATSLDLIKSLWTPMLASRMTSTGASWEYVNLDGGPGLGFYTSLAHPWGGAPTYLLTEWAAGIQTAPGADGFGYRNWVVNPDVGLAAGLRTVSARVVTAFDGVLDVEWRVTTSGDSINVTVKAPQNTNGVFRVGGVEKVLTGSSKYSFSMSIEAD